MMSCIPSFDKKKIKKQKKSSKQVSHEDSEEKVSNSLKEDMDLPVNWPRDVVYIKGCILNENEYHNTLELVPVLRKRIEIRRLNEGHPAYNNGLGYGLYAKRSIEVYQILGEYTGIIYQEGKREKSSRYGLEGHGGESIDAKLAGNEMRFINDYRNIATSPNTQYVSLSSWEKIYPGESDWYFSHHGESKRHVVVQSRKHISKGEELLIDYGEPYCKSWGLI